MIPNVRTRFGSTWLLCKPSVSYSVIVHFSTASTSLAKTLESSSLNSTGHSERSDFDAVLARIVERGSTDEVFHRLAHDETCNTIKVSEKLIQRLLHRFKDDWKYAFGVLKWAESCQGYKYSTEACDIAVDILGKARKWDEMKQFIDKMRLNNLITLNTISKVMRRFAGAGKWKDAIRMFDELNNFGLEKNTDSMNVLLDTLCKENRVDKARSVFLELKSHIPPDAYTFNIFIHGWCKINRVDEAHWTIEEMKGYGIDPCVISYSTIIRYYCRVSSYGEVYKVLDEMEAKKCPANAVTYTIIMSSLTMQKEFDEALKLVDRMKRSGCKPDTLFYNTLIYTLARSGRIEEAIRVVRIEMPRFGIHMNTSSYNAVISMFCHHNDEERALEFLAEMENSKMCRPDALTYHSLLKLCFKKGDVERARRLLDQMVNKHNISLDDSTYTLVILGFCRADRCELAYTLFEAMIRQDLTPRHRVCRVLLKQVTEKGMDEAAERISDIMKKI